MKKASRKRAVRTTDDDDLRPEYDFSKGIRGRTAARYAFGTNIVVLEPDVAKVFPNSAAVNKALRSVARARTVASRKRGA